MPIWQFELAFIPKDAELLTRSRSGCQIAPLPRRLMPGIRSLLQLECGRPCVVGTGVSSYGNLEGNRIDLIEFGTDVRELWACIDARAESDGFCDLVCRLARLSGCELFSPELEATLAPTRSSLIDGLMGSTAWCFAVDPSIFKKNAHGWERTR